MPLDAYGNPLPKKEIYEKVKNDYIKNYFENNWDKIFLEYLNNCRYEKIEADYQSFYNKLPEHLRQLFCEKTNYKPI